VRLRGVGSPTVGYQEQFDFTVNGVVEHGAVRAYELAKIGKNSVTLAEENDAPGVAAITSVRFQGGEKKGVLNIRATTKDAVALDLSYQGCAVLKDSLVCGKVPCKDVQ
jgi:hypothetical protein